MATRALLVLILVLGVIFVWRAGRRYPGIAVLAAGLAAMAGVFLFRHPLLQTLGLLALGGLVFWTSRVRRD